MRLAFCCDYLLIVRLENDFPVPGVEGNDSFMEYFLTYGVYVIWTILNNNGILYYE